MNYSDDELKATTYWSEGRRVDKPSSIEPINNPRDAISKELYDKCMDRLAGRDNMESLLNDIINMPVITNTGTESFINPKDIEFRFEPEPYKHPAYLDRSYMISIDVTQLP